MSIPTLRLLDEASYSGISGEVGIWQKEIPPLGFLGVFISLLEADKRAPSLTQPLSYIV